MKNKIINLAIKQMECHDMNEIFYETPFFREYFKVFCGNKQFDENVIEAIKCDFDMNNVIDLSNKLISIFKNKLTILSKGEIKNEIGLIIFIGDGQIDGHSIIVSNSSYVFVDLKAIVCNINYDLDAFISHEIIHAVHYDLNKEFYPQNYNSIADKYLKFLIEEGVATYLSMHLFEMPENLSYWLGILENDEVNDWKSNCKRLKINMGIRLKELTSNRRFDKNIYNKLFCIKKSEDLTLYRMGYYYGCEIIKNLCNANNINQVLRFKFSNIKDYINDYFEIKIV